MSSQHHSLGRAAAASGAGCAVLFGLVFMVAGLAVGWFAYFPALSDWWRSGSWERVPCQIESVSLKQSRGSKGSITHRVEAEYRYSYHGSEYRGDRVSLMAGSDNMGDFQQRKYQELKAAKEADQPVTCLVNPAQPSESVLTRELRWGLMLLVSLFPTLFPLAGGFIAIGGLLTAREARKVMAQSSLYPDEPWKWKVEWIGEGIRPAKNGLGAYLGIAGWILLMQAPLALAVLTGGEWMRSWLSLLALLPAALAFFPLRAAWRRWRTRTALAGLTLHLTRSPLEPGMELEGTLRLPATLSPRTTLRVTSRCILTVTTGSGKNSTTSRQTLWEETQSLSAAEARREATGCELPLRVKLPAHLPGTDVTALLAISTERREHRWEMDIFLGDELRPLTLPLPVFGEAVETAEKVQPSTQGTTQQLEQRLKARSIQASFQPDGTPELIRCPPGRNRGTAIFLLFFGAIWTAALVMIIVNDAPLIFKLIWGISAPAIELYGVYLLLHQRRLEFGDVTLRVINQAGPFFGGTESLEPRHIIAFTHDNYMRSGNEHHYRVRAETTFGKKITLVDAITEEVTAMQLANRCQLWKEKREV